MTESEFWVYLKAMQSKGRVEQVSGYIDTGGQATQAGGVYCGGHSVLFKGYDTIAKNIVIAMGDLLLNKAVSLQAKEVILMILAHHPSHEALFALELYSKAPNEELKYTAYFALEECRWWNE
ncbi:hypothetical protein ACFL42_00440 [Candidatus Omnitrophota bacterium]